MWIGHALYIKGHALYKRPCPIIKHKTPDMLKWCHEFYNNNKRRLRYKCFWSNFFFSFISLNWINIILPCFVSYFSLKYKSLNCLVWPCLASSKNNVSKSMYFYRLLLLKSLFPPTTNPLNLFFRPTLAAMPNCLTIEAKGQLISKANFKVFIWTKKRTKVSLFLPSLLNG